MSACALPYDTVPGALHIGCFQHNRLIGVGSILPDPRKGATQPASWRIRGMAVEEDARGTGAGRKIVEALISYVEQQGLPAEVWCNGRAHVTGFYQRLGFQQLGDVFEIPGTGPHVVMVKTLAPQ